MSLPLSAVPLFLVRKSDAFISRAFHRCSIWSIQYGILNYTRDISTIGLHEKQEKVRKHVPQLQDLFMWELEKKKKTRTHHNYKAYSKYQQPTRWIVRGFWGNFRISSASIYHKKQGYVNLRESCWKYISPVPTSEIQSAVIHLLIVP